MQATDIRADRDDRRDRKWGPVRSRLGPALLASALAFSNAVGVRAEPPTEGDCRCSAGKELPHIIGFDAATGKKFNIAEWTFDFFKIFRAKETGREYLDHSGSSLPSIKYFKWRKNNIVDSRETKIPWS